MSPLDTIEQARERVKWCAESVAEEPYRHPVAAGWYAEDVPVLLAAVEAKDEALREAMALVIPGKWGREHGYDVPSGDNHEWEAARIALFRSQGMDELADHLIEDRIAVLDASDWSEGTTKRVDAFRAALAARPSEGEQKT